jgi:superfamily II DNA or RNA helicase
MGSNLAVTTRGRGAPTPSLTAFHRRVLAEVVSNWAHRGSNRLTSTLSDARLDLNPHQVEAAAFALESLPQGGCLLADEVGLGKTIEAGLVIAQLLVEGKAPILVISPASVCKQWQLELKEKLGVAASLVDGRSPPMAQMLPSGPLICSFQFAAKNASALARIPWELVVLDEAHHLRNAHRPSHKTGTALRTALAGRPKLLLTATPLQNNLMELFGLVSFLDERILGPEPAFKSRYMAAGASALSEDSAGELKERLSAVVQRTLRRQVQEYVRFTQRRSMVEDFTPTAEEEQLYEKVSAYLQRAEVAAIEPSRRTLLTLVYRKLLASSSHAIAPTLRKLADRLRARVVPGAGNDPLALGLEPGEMQPYSEELEEWSEEGLPPPPPPPLASEIRELEGYAEAAEHLRSNAKGEALVRALDRTFTIAHAHRWPKKAVVFTESKRTQAYLFSLLSEHGYRDRIAQLSGDTGNASERQAAIDDFANRAQILLSTDAGAEGLNLQFCNLVVNYDLPWNPQRIEQRIGRCHRYGQQRDVLVINFLNRRNAADARLFELLEKKLKLFDGVFGASDEILGALQNGVDFERRILHIYQSCRSPDEINAAFDALRSDLEHQIDERMMQTRSLLLDRFDTEVRRQMRVLEREAQQSIDEHRRRARALVRSALGHSGEISKSLVNRAVEAARQEALAPVHFLRLDPTFLPSKLAPLIGAEGWWLAYRFEVQGLQPQVSLVQLILIKEGDGFRPLPLEDAECFLSLPAREEAQRRPAAVSFSQMHERALAAAREQILRQVNAQNALELDRARERIDRYTEDCLQDLRQALSQVREEWERARKRLPQLEDEAQRARERAQIAKRESEYRKRLAALRCEEETRHAQKDRAMEDLLRRAQVRESRSLVASAYFWLS